MVTKTLKKGYKETDLGIIPEDWQIKSLNEVSSMHGRIGWQGLKQTEFTMNAEEPFLITGMNFKDGEIIWREVYHISNQRYEMAKDIQLKPKDVLMTKDGTIGKVLFIDKIPSPCKASLNSHLLVFRPIGNSYAPRFLFYLLDSRFFRKHVELTKSGSTFFGISQEAVGKFKMPLPKKHEQEAIALVLRDIDGLIAKLGQLIKKKKLIKQAAMQMLLTGKKRLSSYDSKWEIKRLGEIAEIFDGTHLTPKYVEDGIPFYSVESVTSNNFSNTKFISEKEHKLLTKSYRIEKNDILMTRIGSIGECKLVDWDVNASFYVSLALLKIKQAFSSEYVYQYSKSSFFKKETEINSLQWATPKKINLGDISKINLLIPCSKEEQLSIANLLTDMDLEIESLEHKMNKCKLLKVGLMQQLLTGRIRLQWKS